MKKKKRWLIRLTLLAVLAAFVVWLEPTRVIWGWLRGEAFYQGRPTSYWCQELDKWKPVQVGVSFDGFGMTERFRYTRERNWIQSAFPKFFPNETTPWPTLLDGDIAGKEVLTELEFDARPNVRELARVGIIRTEQRHLSGYSEQGRYVVRFRSSLHLRWGTGDVWDR